MARVLNSAATGGTGQSRYQHISTAIPSRVVRPDPNKAYIVEGRTRYPKSVVSAGQSPRVLVSGVNSAKTGRWVTVGPWEGAEIYTLTLEERASCPDTCAHWLTCYGNDMHFARRISHNAALMPALEQELEALSEKHRETGFVVRLHVLGDFFSPEYARTWHGWLGRFDPLRVFGYTALDRKHANQAPIASWVHAMNTDYPDRCTIRWSSLQPRPMGAHSIMVDPTEFEGKRFGHSIICPQQIGKLPTCGECGLCWHPSYRWESVGFVLHGRPARKEP